MMRSQLVLAAALTAAAFSTVSPAPLAAQKSLCFDGSRLPVCSNFVIFEMQGVLPAAQTTRTIRWPQGESIDQEAFGDRLEWNLGIMHNVSDRWAVGGAIGLGSAGARSLTSLTARGRRWMTDDIGLDVSAGLLFGPHEVGGGQRMGTIADARLNFSDDVYGGVRWEQMGVRASSDYSIDPGGRQHALSLLVGTGSEWAVGTTGALGTWLAILWGVAIAND